MNKDFQLGIHYRTFKKNNNTLVNFMIDKRYLIIEKLVGGANGQIYKAVDVKNSKERYVIVKLLLIKKIRDEQVNEKRRELKLKYIQQEDNIMRNFKHPNILKWICTYRNKDFKIIITKFCEQGTLKSMIQKYGCLQLPDAINILKQISSAVVALHSKNVIHRDLKPDNIFVHYGNYIIGDFGLSKALEGAQMKSHTICGTQYTQAPEVSTGIYGPNADIYSLGVILFIMLFSNKNVPIDRRGMMAKNMDLNNIQLYLKQGVKAPQVVIDFLKLTLQKKPQKRMTYKELLSHPIFEYRSANKIPNLFAMNLHLISQQKQQLNAQREQIEINEQSVKNSKKQVQKREQIYSVQSELEQKNTKQGKQKDDKGTEQIQDMVILEQRKKSQQIPIADIIQRLETQQINNLVQLCSQQQDEQITVYRKIQFFHLHIKIAEFIYKQIIERIQNYNLLDLKSKQNVELMYLLSARCFINMSYINAKKFQLPFQKFDQEVKNYLNNQIKQFYQNCKQKFDFYSRLLFNKQSQILQMVSYKLKSFIRDKKDLKGESIIFEGIQGIDFTKQEHVTYIQQKYLNKITEVNSKDEAQKNKLFARFKIFKKVNQITVDDLQNDQFDDIVKDYLYD